MNEALCSILSGEDEWCFDTEGRSIKFNKDGTGELWCRCNFNYWIAAELEWKSIGPLDRVEPPEMASATQNKGPHLLGQLNLEITLAKRLPRRVQNSDLSKSTMINELSLTDDAFRPKSYTVGIEKGNFIEPCYVGYSSSGRPRFALRLVFNESPYPPRPEWRNPERGVDEGQFWDHKEFVGRSSPELEKQGRAMNDLPPAGWNPCVVS
ncbi:hypothetical protein GP486_005584 [Trichoglossum hirsutum]|uniref:Uncharacterized protein n=1 Tax=Trichoglossum hirsutum TaxID=265104 RepID=A0A9P8L8W9_9PEZI|nr:hypothetical protein GP486_005584 [Trichoglossum hirsutum]